MKIKSGLILLVCLFLLTSILSAKLHFRDDVSITFVFANGEITIENSIFYYEFDIMTKASEEGTLLGSNMVYVNYNSIGFGESVVENDNCEVTMGELLQGEIAPGVPLYQIINIVDNTDSGFAVTVDYNFPTEPSWANELPTEFVQLLHIKLVIANSSEHAGLSFYEDLMEGQQYQSDNMTIYSPVIATDTDNSPLYQINVQKEIIPTKLTCSPNPFGRKNESVNINFTIDQRAFVEIKIYNIVGQFVNRIYKGEVLPNQTVNLQWDGKNEKGISLSSGIYFMQLFGDKKIKDSQKILMLR